MNKDEDDIKTSLLNIKDIINRLLLQRKIRDIGNTELEIRDKVRKIIYSPKTDVVYIYVNGKEIAKMVIEDLLELFKKNRIYVEMDIQIIGECGILELNFGETELMEQFKKAKIKNLVSL